MEYGMDYLNVQGLEKHVGERIRLRRSELGLTQDKLAEMTGVSFQQIQKYETGLNAMRITSLFRLSRVLLVDVTYFFEGFREHALNDASRNGTFVSSSSKEVMGLMRNYQRIASPKIRKNVSALIRALSSEEDATTKE